MRYIYSLLLFLSISIPLCAKDEFTALEQQQISIETPGLFDKSNTFQTDFTKIRNSEYAFPLPVGKVTVNSGIMDIETKKGDVVKAMFDGIVRLVKNNTAQHGNVIVIRHGNGMETVYAFNSQNNVKVGQHVKAGQTIAIVGQNGGKVMCRVTIMVNGGRINAETVLDINTHALHRQVLTFKKVGNRVEVTTFRKDKKKSEEQPAMSMDTNDPFGDNAVYRLDLKKIKSWHYPLDDSHVISDFGGARGHSGVDIKNGPNMDIYAAFDGLVVQSGNFAGYGKCITIRHPNGLETRYSHNNKNYVNVGDKVKAGQVIGTTGRTGRATTEHLHFETRIAGRSFNPAYVFNHATHSLINGVLQFKKNGSVTRLKDEDNSSNSRNTRK